MEEPSCESSLNSEIVPSGKPIGVFNQAMGKCTERCCYLVAFSFQEKSHYVDPQGDIKFIFYRTVYRHRWIGRED